MKKNLAWFFTPLLLYSPQIYASFGPGFWSTPKKCRSWVEFNCHLHSTGFDLSLVILYTPYWIPGTIVLWILFAKKLLKSESIGFWKVQLVSILSALFINLFEVFLATLINSMRGGTGWSLIFFAPMIYLFILGVTIILFKMQTILVLLKYVYTKISPFVVPPIYVRAKIRPFAVPFFILIILYFGLDLYWKRPYSEQLKVEPVIQTSSHVNYRADMVIPISDDIRHGKITIQELDQKLAEAKTRPETVNQMFHLALSLCREDYLNVLLKYPMMPDPRNYPKSFIYETYPKIEQACENFYRRMGWTAGCEINFNGSHCEEWLHFEDQYLQYVRKWQDPNFLKCQQDLDCFSSTGRRCLTNLPMSKLSMPKEGLEEESSMRCRYEKLRFLCRKENPSFLKCDEPIVSISAQCKNSLCTIIQKR